MAKKTSKRDDAAAGAGRMARRCLIWAAVLGLVVTALWLGATQVWAAIARRPEFVLDPSALSFRNCPPCVRGDEMADELREQLTVALGNASIFEEDLCHRVQNELRARPWVLEVKSVRRVMPHKLDVAVVFREPAGLVEFGNETYMLDADGYCLPTDLYRLPEGWDSGAVPVIVDRRLGSAPPRAQKWDGPSLAAGARLSAFLRGEGLFEELPVETIDVTNVGSGGHDPEILMRTRNGVTIKWGCSDGYAGLGGLERSSWTNPDGRKLEMLRSKLKDYPGLEGLEYIDLRFNTKIFLRPITQRPGT